jgi:thiol-disulfide isomerase/thioredoxin
MGSADVIEFEKKRIAKNRNLTLNELELIKEIPLKELKGWSAYALKLNVSIKEKKTTLNDILFSNGEFITTDLMDIKSSKSIKKDISIDLSNKYYRDSHRIAGTKGAKHKIVIFSDPQCPFCMDYVPDVISYVEKHSKDIELFYYHFPLLMIHPASETIVKASIVAHKKGAKDIIKKVYDKSVDFNPTERDSKKVLETFNKLLKTDITLKEIEDSNVQKEYDSDLNMAFDVLVSGTPTIFIDGKKDNSKKLYKKLVK